MGNKQTRLVNYEDAVEMLDDRFNILHDDFKQLSRNGIIDKGTFIRCALERIPLALQEDFYRAMGGTSRGISFKDVVCAMAVYLSNSRELRRKFIFNVYDRSGSHTIRQEDFEALALPGEPALPKHLETQLAQVQEMTEEDFQRVVDKWKDCTSLVAWIYTSIADPADEVDFPSFHDTVAEITCFSSDQVRDIESQYFRLQPLGKPFSAEAAAAVLSPTLPAEAGRALWKVFDADGDDHVSVAELAVGLSKIAANKPEELHSLIFNMFSEDGSSISTRQLETILGVAAKLLPSERDQSKLPDIDALLKQVRACKSSKQGVASEKQDSFDKEQFVCWCGSSPPMLQPLLLALKQVCHVVFAVQPSSHDMEKDVVLGYLRLEELRSRQLFERKSKEALQNGILYVDGEMTFLVARSWWDAWLNSKHKDTLNTLKSQSSDSASASPVLGAATIRHLPLCKTDSSVSKRKHFVPSGMFGPRLASDFKASSVVPVPPAVWHALRVWYGADVSLLRPVYWDDKGCRHVEYFPYSLKVHRHVPAKKSKGTGSHNPAQQVQKYSVEFSAYADVSQFQSLGSVKSSLLEEMRRIRAVPGQTKLEEVRLWDYANSDHPSLLDDDNMRVGDTDVGDGGSLLLEVRNQDLTWPSELYAMSQAAQRMASQHSRQHTADQSAAASTTSDMSTESDDIEVVDLGASKGEKVARGVTGLSNMGNTCFLNSAIQCITHAPALTAYFLSGVYQHEANLDNPLGYKGIVAKRYADLTHQLWAGKSKAVAPLKLRSTLAKHAPRFADSAQHDSQELLSFILDALHEDLNRVREKPYIERKDSDGRPDQIVATESWEAHLARNRSIVVDTFQGLLKSQLRCLTCGFTSVTFDPFTFLTLPLPTESTSSVDVVLIRADGSPPIKYAVEVAADATYHAVRRELNKLLDAPVAYLFLDAIGGYVHRLAKDHDRIRPASLYAYEVDADALRHATGVEPAPSHAATHRKSMDEDGSADAEMTDSKDNTSGRAHAGEDEGLSRHTAGTNQPSEVANQSSDEVQESTDAHVDEGSLEEHNRPFDRSTTAERDVTNPATPNKRGSMQRAAQAPGMPVSLRRRHIPGHLACLHRKLGYQTPGFVINTVSVTLFGRPIVLPVAGRQLKRNELYDAIWQRCRRFVAEQKRLQIDAKKIPYPFELTQVTQDGRACALCPWFRLCTGCHIPNDDGPCEITPGTCVGIDWNVRFYYLHYRRAEEYRTEEHESVAKVRESRNKPVTIDDCLAAFCKEEVMDPSELWYCSKCKEHRQAAKKMDIWSLPPYLIIHLKRFQLVNGRWVKSNSRVKFPVKGFEPYKYWAHAPASQSQADSTGRDSEDASSAKSPVSVSENGTKEGSASETDAMPNGDLSPNHTDGSGADEINRATIEDDDVRNGTNGDGATNGEGGDHAEHINGSVAQAVEGNNSEPTIDFKTIDPHADFYKDPSGDRRYDLFALSTHVGVLGGGHYIAYAQNDDSKWYQFNDSVCHEVPLEQVQDESECAYMLFYKCRGLDESRFIPEKRGSKVDIPDDENLLDLFDQKRREFCVVM